MVDVAPRSLCPLLGVLLSCGGPADELGSGAGPGSSSAAATETSSSGDPTTTTSSGGTTTDPVPSGPPRILDLGADLTAMTEDDTVTFTAALDDPDGDDDVAWGELRRADDDAVVAAFARARSGRWTASVTWTSLAGTLSFAGPIEVEVIATFADLADERAQAAATLTLYCAGLSGGACVGTCVDFDSSDVHCGGCDQPCATRCQAGTCPPG